MLPSDSCLLQLCSDELQWGCVIALLFVAFPVLRIAPSGDSPELFLDGLWQLSVFSSGPLSVVSCRGFGCLF